MARRDRLRELAEVAWDSMRGHDIAPTPRNYEVWLAFCGMAKAGLTQRIDRVLGAGEAITAGLLDDVYREFFAADADIAAVRDGTLELQNIAGEIFHRLTRDRSSLSALGESLAAVSAGLHLAGSTQDPERAIATIGDATGQAGERLRALEQVLAASMAGMADLRERLTKAENDVTKDALTGLVNRRAFDAALVNASRHARIEKSPLSLLMLDIDHFRHFNENFGHALGDNVLRLFARVVLDNIKGRDTASRYGGEEFAIILPGAQLSGAVTIAEQIRRALGQRPIVNRSSGQRLGLVTCSIGAAQYRTDEPIGDFVERADQALDDAKRSGRNTVRS